MGTFRVRDEGRAPMSGGSPGATLAACRRSSSPTSTPRRSAPWRSRPGGASRARCAAAPSTAPAATAVTPSGGGSRPRAPTPRSHSSRPTSPTGPTRSGCATSTSPDARPAPAARRCPPYIPPGRRRRLKVGARGAVAVHMRNVNPVIAAVAEEWPPFGLTEEPLPGGLVLAVSGELDLATAPAVRERLGAAVDSGVTRIVVDLRDVTFMDSIGLAAVVHARSRLLADGRLALVVAPGSYAELVLEITGLPRALAIFGDREAAVAHVR